MTPDTYRSIEDVREAMAKQMTELRDQLTRELARLKEENRRLRAEIYRIQAEAKVVSAIEEPMDILPEIQPPQMGASPIFECTLKGNGRSFRFSQMQMETVFPVLLRHSVNWNQVKLEAVLALEVDGAMEDRDFTLRRVA